MRLKNTEADLRVPLFKTSNGQKSISFRGPKLWNQLSSDVRLAPSLLTFKGGLKKKLQRVDGVFSYEHLFIKLFLFLLK